MKVPVERHLHLRYEVPDPACIVLSIPIPSTLTWNTRLTGAILYRKEGAVVGRNVSTSSPVVRPPETKEERLRAHYVGIVLSKL